MKVVMTNAVAVVRFELIEFYLLHYEPDIHSLNKFCIV